MRLGKLSYVTLWSVRFAETRKLYKEILGLPVLEEKPNFLMFDTMGSKLAFHSFSERARFDRPSIELHFEVRDVDEVYESLKRRGIRFKEKPVDKKWGNRIASFLDPEGCEIEIIGRLNGVRSNTEVSSH